MAEQNSSDSRRRGGGFPSMSLKDAVDAVVSVGLNGPDHTVDAFAAYLGHATSNSGAFRSKLASFRDWGLISRGDADRVTLSGLAEELVLRHPDHYEDRTSLLAAFESCRIFGMLYNDSAKNTPLEVTRLRTTALMRYGVGNAQADKFVDSFVQSAVFAGLAKVSGSSVTLLPRDAVAMSVPTEEDEGNSGQMASVPVAAKAAHGAVADPISGVPIALRQQWPIDEGEIEFVIRTAAALPPNVYALVAEMADVAERMKEKLTGPALEVRESVDVPTASQPSAPGA